jgi:antitoxin VapB
MPRADPAARTLNLKNPEVYRLAHELAAATGESMTEAVRLSLEERLDRVKSSAGVEVAERIRRIQETARTLRELAPPGWWGQDFDALLYDEDGLPK